MLAGDRIVFADDVLPPAVFAVKTLHFHRIPSDPGPQNRVLVKQSAAARATGRSIRVNLPKGDFLGDSQNDLRPATGTRDLKCSENLLSHHVMLLSTPIIRVF